MTKKSKAVGAGCVEGKSSEMQNIFAKPARTKSKKVISFYFLLFTF